MADQKPNLKVTRHRRYVKSYSDKNNNKFWYITEFEDGSIYVEFGRIGKAAQSKLHPPGAKDFDKLCRSKEKGKKDEPGYRQLDVVDAPSDGTTTTTTKSVSSGNLATLAARQIANGDRKIEELVKYLAKQNVHNIVKNTTMTYNDATGLFSTPCGVVTQNNIDEARELLSDMKDYIDHEDWGDGYRRKLEDYLMLIPQEVKNMRDTANIIPDDEAVDKQNNILDSLQASLDQMANQPKSKKKTTDDNKVFKVTLESVPTSADPFKRIKRMYEDTNQGRHSCSYLRLKEIYSVDIEEMRKRFEKQGKPVGNIKQLWHGTRVANVLSILHKGLIIPPSNASHCTGRMFGNGLYFSDQSTKSLNYSYGYWGGGRDENCFMFVADVAMGREYIPSGGWRTVPKSGYDSCFAKAGRSGVMNNEMIVYKLSQCNLVYLCKFGR